MSSFLILDWVHLVAAVIFAGYALFWLVMAFALRSTGGEQETGETLSLIGRSGWPPVAVPKAMRISILGLGWMLVLSMAVSGVLLLRARGIGLAAITSGAFWRDRLGLVIAAKATLLVLFAATHARLARRPRPNVALVGAILLAMIVCAAALL